MRWNTKSCRLATISFKKIQVRRNSFVPIASKHWTIRERGGETLPGVFKTEASALSWIKARVEREPFCMRMKRPHGTICTPALR
jgi:hypothetical protein